MIVEDDPVICQELRVLLENALYQVSVPADRSLLFILHICCMLLMSGFLYAAGYPGDYIFLLQICWMLLLAVVSGVSYRKKKRYFTQMEKILQQVDQRYLLGELMPGPVCLEDSIYRDMIRTSNKSAIEKIRDIEDGRKEYREFIEGWVHEIKAPITGISLICENHKGEYERKIGRLNQKTWALVEMALYYARSDEVYKDYMIQKTSLQDTVSEVLSKIKYLLIQSGMTAEVRCSDEVYTDEKWISFILNQIVLNIVKYKRERVFEKGFTGSNGRKTEQSTGMGLYLCKVLCGKLGIEIGAESVEGEGTKIVLEFPVGDYYAREAGGIFEEFH